MSLDPDVQATLRKSMRERGVSFDEALGEAIRDGSAKRAEARPCRFATYRMGFPPKVEVDKGVALAASLEDEELVRKLAGHE